MRRRAVAVLLLISLGTAAYSSLVVHPYSLASPKRTAITHVVLTEPWDGGEALDRHDDRVMEIQHPSERISTDAMHDLAEAALFNGDGRVQTDDRMLAEAKHDMAEAALFTGVEVGGVREPAAAYPELLRHQGKAASPAGANQCLSGQAPGMRVASTRISFGSTDSVPIEFAFAPPLPGVKGGIPPLQGFSSRSPQTAEDAEGSVTPPSPLQPVASNGREFTSVFPVSSLLKGNVHFEGPPAVAFTFTAQDGGNGGKGAGGQPLEQLPYICRTLEDEVRMQHLQDLQRKLKTTIYNLETPCRLEVASVACTSAPSPSAPPGAS